MCAQQILQSASAALLIKSSEYSLGTFQIIDDLRFLLADNKKMINLISLVWGQILEGTFYHIILCVSHNYDPYIRKHTFRHVPLAKIQLNLCIGAVWLESSLGAFWIAKYTVSI